MNDDEVDKRGMDLIHSMVDVSRETQRHFQAYIRLLRQWQKKMNLVAPSTMDAVWERHIADSVQTFCLAPFARHWIDIGSGAGFPGLVSAILMADKADMQGSIHLIESVGKKCAFMNAVGRDIDLKSAGVELHIHRGRIEHVLPQLDAPDVISARALAPLPTLMDMSQIYLNKETIGLFSKGQDFATELELAQKQWDFDVEIHTSQFQDKSVILEISNLAKKVV